MIPVRKAAGLFDVAHMGTLEVSGPYAVDFLDLVGATSLIPLVTVFGNIQFPEPGGYVFIVEHEGQELSRIPLRVQPPHGIRPL